MNPRCPRTCALPSVAWLAARDELRRLVEQLPEEQLLVVLAEVQRLVAASEPPGWPQPWFGAMTSARSDTSQRMDQLLAEGSCR
jgi:hypothetical protein